MTGTPIVMAPWGPDLPVAPLSAAHLYAGDDNNGLAVTMCGIMRASFSNSCRFATDREHRAMGCHSCEGAFNAAQPVPTEGEEWITRLHAVPTMFDISITSRAITYKRFEDPIRVLVTECYEDKVGFSHGHGVWEVRAFVACYRPVCQYDNQ